MVKKKGKEFNENFAEMMRLVKEKKDAASQEGVTNDPHEGVTNDPQESVTNDPQESVTNDPQEGVTNDPQEGVTNDPLNGVMNDPRKGVTNDPLKGVMNDPQQGLKISREVKTPTKKKNYMMKTDVVQKIKDKAQLLDVSESVLVNILLEYALGKLKIE